MTIEASKTTSEYAIDPWQHRLKNLSEFALIVASDQPLPDKPAGVSVIIFSRTDALPIQETRQPS